MAKVTIDGQEVEIEDGYTILQAAQMVNKEIPIFCYHPKLEIAGNCRMCLVELEGAPKPVASCAMPASNGMVIKTNTEMVHKARKGVLEFLLINHPLDCPICDQGGECDLQDITMAYGPSTSRFNENKRAVPDKYMGPLIKTFMTRCIHCTRCVRFSDEIAGTRELGAVGRGEQVEISSYIDQAVTSELSGNVIDICPVGALTSRPYSFKGRPWEIRKTESVDVLDAVGSNIRIDSDGMQVVRILPRLHEEVNEDWISDKTRFSYDGLQCQRLDRPYVRKDGKLQAVSWDEALATVAFKMQETPAEKMAAIAGDQADVESMTALKDLLVSKGVKNLDCRQDGAKLTHEIRASYLFNTTIAGIEEADYCLIIGSNVRFEAPMIHARIRKSYLKNPLNIGYIGPELSEAQDFKFDYEHFGDEIEILKKALNPSSKVGKALKAAKKPMLIIGQDVLAREDGAVLLNHAKEIANKYDFVQDGWNGFNVLHQAAARVGGLDIGFVPEKEGRDAENILFAASRRRINFVYLLGADEIDMKKLKSAFVVYQGHHGDEGARHADVVLPGAAYTEKNATYVNTEGRVQQTKISHSPPGEAKEDWKIIRALSEKMGSTLPYDTLQDVRSRMAEINPIFNTIDEIVPAEWADFGEKGAEFSDAALTLKERNFYMTDPITRHSKTMAECSETFVPKQKGRGSKRAGKAVR